MNRDHLKLADHYGKNCGKWTIVGSAVDGSETRYHRLNCKCWQCAHCGPKKAGRYKHVIREAAEKHKLTRFLTLTLDPKKLGSNATPADSIKHLRNSFNKFRVYLSRKFGESIQYIAVIEFQKNGNAHLHLLIDRYVEQGWIKSAWSKVGGGEHVDIRQVDLHRVSRYLSKYLTKELLLSAPKKTRRITSSRGITLSPKSSRAVTHTWTVKRQSIFWLFYRFEDIATNVEHDEWLLLLSFVIPGPASFQKESGLAMESR